MAPEPRVCWLTEEYPPETGGTGLMAARICRGLAARGVPTRAVTRQTRPARQPEEWLDGVHVRRIKPAGRLKGAGWRALPAMIVFLMRLSALLVREACRYDVIVVSSMKIIPLAAVPLGRWLNKACVIRLESPFELIEPIAAESLGAMGSRAGGPAYRTLGALGALVGAGLARVLGALQRAILRRADCIVAISRDLESSLQQMCCPSARILRIPNATDLRRFLPVTEEEKVALRARLHLPSSCTLVLYAGRLSRAKGVLMLIEGWAELAAAHPDLHLAIVGSGKGSWDDCEAELAGRVRVLALGARVSLVGESDRVHEYMQASDIYVCPSDYEGFSLSIGEALACGLPAVVTSVGAAPEIIEHGLSGFLFPPKDLRAMIAALELCLAQRARWPQISRRARESAEPFDLDRVVDRYAALARELARAPGRAARPAASRARLRGSSSDTRARH